MKTLNHLELCMISCIIFLSACKKEPVNDGSKIQMFNAAELEKIIDNATRIEAIGSPEVSRAQGDSTVIITTTQTYRLFVATGDDGRIIERPDSATVALKPATGPIIITTSCNMVCTPVNAGEPCNVSGCTETKKCGCSQGSCGNNCTTDTPCHQARSGFGFGTAIIF